MTVLTNIENYITENKRQSVAELITRLNFCLRMGNFDLDMDDGELRFRVSIKMEEGLLTSGMIGHLMMLSTVMMDRVYPLVMGVVYGGMSPKDAAQKIIRKNGVGADPDESEGNTQPGRPFKDLQANEPFDLIMWVIPRTGEVRNATVAPRSHLHKALIMSLVQAMMTPFSRGRMLRPTKVSIRRETDRKHLKESLSLLNIRTEQWQSSQALEKRYDVIWAPIELDGYQRFLQSDEFLRVHSMSQIHLLRRLSQV